MLKSKFGFPLCNHPAPIREESRMDTKECYRKAQKSFVGGSSAAGRYHAALGMPLYVKCADGAYVTDLDDKRYLDFHNAAGAAFFGFNHPRLQKAVAKSVEMGFFLNFETEYHYQLADALCSVIPSAQKVRLSNTGTEATMAAIRLARAYTGRDKIIRFEGHFHGMSELIFYNHGNLGDRDSHGEIGAIPDSAGFPKSFSNEIIVVEFNRPDALEHVVRKYVNQVAAIIMEPVCFNCGCVPAKPGYLQAVREICDREGIVLIFDEVLSGFRPGIGGAQEHYGVTPDLTTLAKALGGGFPIAALVGKKLIMEKLNPVGPAVMSGTYTGSLMPVLVALECLKMMQEPSFYSRLNALSQKLFDGLDFLFEKHGVPGHVRGIGNRFATYFGIEDPETDFNIREVAKRFDSGSYKAFIRASLERQLYFPLTGWATGSLAFPSHAGISSAYTEADIDDALGKLEEVFRKLSKPRIIGKN